MSAGGAVWVHRMRMGWVPSQDLTPAPPLMLIRSLTYFILLTSLLISFAANAKEIDANASNPFDIDACIKDSTENSAQSHGHFFKCISASGILVKSLYLNKIASNNGKCLFQIEEIKADGSRTEFLAAQNAVSNLSERCAISDFDELVVTNIASLELYGKVKRAARNEIRRLRSAGIMKVDDVACKGNYALSILGFSRGEFTDYMVFPCLNGPNVSGISLTLTFKQDKPISASHSFFE